jgi:hypothetical protein
VLVAGDVHAVPKGYVIDGAFQIGSGAGAIVPNEEARPSPDGEYWRCKRPNRRSSAVVANSREGRRSPRSSVLTAEGQHAGEVVVVLLGERQSDGDLTTASRQDEEARASQDQARKSRTDDGAGDWVRLAINEVIHNGYTRTELAGRQSYIASCYPDTAHFG